MSFGLNKNRIVSMILIVAFFMWNMASPAMATNRAHIEKKRRETRAKIHTLKILEKKETNKLYRNQLKLEQNQQNLRQSKAQYVDTRNKLASLEQELARSIAVFSFSEFKTRSRIRQIYKKQRSGLFELLLSTNDLNLFLDRIYYQNLIARSDKQRLVAVRERARTIARLKMQAEEQRRLIASSVENIKTEQVSIQNAIDQNASMIQKLRTDRKAYERSEKELARQSASLRNMIQRHRYNGEIKVTSGFLKPIGGPITSPFGWRVHPIFKSRTFHSGIDIGGRYGGSVRAANSGRVIYSGWYGGYGKVIIIDHGRYNGVPTTTLYAHLSGQAVSTGAYVTKGQVVGYEGSTGYSTGPHVHFEVRVNGQPCNPLGYI